MTLTHWLPAMFSLLRQPRRTGARVAAKFYSDSCVAIRNTLIHTCTDRRKPKGQPATCLMALFYSISHQWHHSYTVYFGLYVGLSPVAQADLDRLRGQTSHCGALFAYSTYPKYILCYSSEGRTCPTCSQRHSWITCCAKQRTECLQWRTYIRPWHTHNAIERRI